MGGPLPPQKVVKNKAHKNRVYTKFLSLQIGIENWYLRIGLVWELRLETITCNNLGLKDSIQSSVKWAWQMHHGLLVFSTVFSIIVLEVFSIRNRWLRENSGKMNWQENVWREYICILHGRNLIWRDFSGRENELAGFFLLGIKNGGKIGKLQNLLLSTNILYI